MSQNKTFWTNMSVIGILAIGTLIISLLFKSYFLEDAYMHLRYTLNSVNSGLWSVWNICEEPVSGDTSPLWLAILVTFYKIGIDPQFLSRLIGALSFFGIGWQLYRIYNFSHNTEDKGINKLNFSNNILFVIGIFSLTAVVYYSFTGMETLFSLWLLILLISSKSKLSTALRSIPVVLVRPEGALFIFVIIVSKYWKRWREILIIGLPSFFVFVIYLTWHYSYFGYLFPNTYYAKADLSIKESLFYGCRSVLFFLKDYYLLLIFAGLALVRKKLNIFDKTVLIVSGLLVLYMFKVGGDNAAAFPHHRHLLFLIVFAWLYAFIFINKISASFKRPIPAAVLLVFALFLSHFTSEMRTEGSPFSNLKPMVKSFIGLPSVTHGSETNRLPDLNEILAYFPDSTYVATAAAGQIPAQFPKLNFIDVLGLHDEHIARNGKRQFGQVDCKSDQDYVIARSPSIIVLPIASIHVHNGVIKNGISHWRNPVDDSFNNPDFIANYLFLPSTDNSVFVHRGSITLLPEMYRADLKELDFID